MISKTIAIIPARGNSKRLPNKNIKLLGGIPLLVHSVNYAKSHNFIDDIYVSTNCDQIKQIALQNDVLVIDRPQELSGDFEPTITAIQHVLEEIPKIIENVILLQATNPLRPENLLNKAFHFFEENKLDSLFTVSPSKQKLGKIVNHQFVPINYDLGQRSQDMETLYFENGLLYITKVSLLKKGKIISVNSYPYIVNHIFGNLDIDEQEDLNYANFLFYNK